MSEAEASTFDLTSTRIFAVPPDAVWQAWSDPELVMRWWGPTGFTSPLCKMDFREGGATLVCMRAPAEWGGFDMYNTWNYTLIAPHERIEFFVLFSDAEGNWIDPEAQGLPADVPKQGVPHVVTLTALADGGTELSISEFGYGSAATRDNSQAGLEQCLDKMTAIFAG